MIVGPPIPKSISVVIPTVNEAASLPETVRRLRMIPEVCEVLIADGGSTDESETIARSLGCRWIPSPRGRGFQMRFAAKLARGDVIWLVHADTWVPENAGSALLSILQDPTVVAGGFWKEFRDPSFLLRGARLKTWVRFALARRIMGDQAMFIRRETLESINGVPAVALMEEFELCRALRKAGRLKLADATVTTSARRFQKHGVIRTYGLMWSIMFRYYLGATPSELAKRYL